uniref:glutamine synthetase n=1 Tax=viral metagenome TaxID=1070528 RepID=A0A6C0J5X8_9ZZZZ
MNYRQEYIWIGGNNELRSKVKYSKDDKLTEWNYDGSSTNQANNKNSEVILKPVRTYNDPFTKGKFVLCETWVLENDELKPHKTNLRKQAENIFKDSDSNKPLFGIEHEFFLMSNKNVPIGYFNSSTPKQGQYYCSVGTGNAYGRDFLNLACELCIKAGLNITGSNLEVAPGQMEIQLCEYGLKAADDSIILKYILDRMGEANNLKVNWNSKPLKGDWNGSGCHINFSTKQMREPDGLNVIMECMKKLELKHKEHIDVYGNDNNERLTGKHETSDLNKFSYGFGSRGTSIRIPNSTKINKCGYFEDRRPSSSVIMYLAISKLYNTCIN